MGFDEQMKDGHRVYWPEKRRVSVERNVKFNFEPEEVIVGNLPLEGEQSVAGKRSPVITPETMDQINHPGTIETELHHISTENLPNRQANPTVDSEPLVGRGKRVRKETEYVRLLRDGSGVTGGRGSVLPKGIQQGTALSDPGAIQAAIMREDGKEVEHAMATMIESAQRLTPTYAEAKRRPDWPKWEEAIQKELKGLDASGTWRLVKRPPNTNVVDSKWVLKIKKNAAGEVDKYIRKIPP